MLHTHSTLSCINTLSLSTDELSLEELLALYDLEQHSTSPDTTLESSSKPDTSVLGQTHCEHCVCVFIDVQYLCDLCIPLALYM